MELDDDYSFTEDQRLAMQELNTLDYANYHGNTKSVVCVVEDKKSSDFNKSISSPYSVSARLQEINERLKADDTPIEMDRQRRVNFKEHLVEYKELSSLESSDDGYGDSPDGLFEDDKEELERYDDLEVDRVPLHSSSVVVTSCGSLSFPVAGNSGLETSLTDESVDSEDDEEEGTLEEETCVNASIFPSIRASGGASSTAAKVKGLTIPHDKVVNNCSFDLNASEWDDKDNTGTSQTEQLEDQGDEANQSQYNQDFAPTKLSPDDDKESLTSDETSQDDSDSDDGSTLEEPNDDALVQEDISDSCEDSLEESVEEVERELHEVKERTKKYCYVYQQPEEIVNSPLFRRRISITSTSSVIAPGLSLRQASSLLQEQPSKSKVAQREKSTSCVQSDLLSKQTLGTPSRLTYSKACSESQLYRNEKITVTRSGRRVLTRAPGVKCLQPHRCTDAKSTTAKPRVPDIRPLNREKLPGTKLALTSLDRKSGLVNLPKSETFELVRCDDLIQQSSSKTLIKSPSSNYISSKSIPNTHLKNSFSSSLKPPVRNVFSNMNVSSIKQKGIMAGQKKSISLNQLPTNQAECNSLNIKNNTSEVPSASHSKSTDSTSKRKEESQISFKLWLEKKNEQIKIEKRMSEIRQREELKTEKPTREECEKAFREWLALKKLRKQVPIAGMLRGRRNGSLERDRSSWNHMKKTLNVYLSPV